MSEVEVTFNQCLGVLNRFLKEVEKPDGEPDVNEANKGLDDLDKIHKKLLRLYNEKLFGNTALSAILKSTASKSPTKPKKSKVDLKEMTFEYCLKELRNFLNAVKSGERPDVKDAKKCLDRLKKIHDTLSRHYNAGRNFVSCEDSGAVRIFD